jgi:hypothetical protein
MQFGGRVDAMGLDNEFFHRFSESGAVNEYRWRWRRAFAFILLSSSILWAAIFAIAYFLWTL